MKMTVDLIFHELKRKKTRSEIMSSQVEVEKRQTDGNKSTATL